MTPAEVKQMVEEVAQTYDKYDDDERCHSMQDGIYEALLEAIADGSATDPAGCAREALEIKRIEFARWYA